MAPAGPGGAAPERLTRALAAQARWREAGIHLAGVRHHSPGCAQALAALLDEVRPRTVLIEGPREYDALLPALADPATRPPVAVLSVGERRSGFYPLADFSPEWVALRWGSTQGAEVAFIDAGYAETDDPAADEVRTLQAEHHLARSEQLAALATRLGCRDHDETWEHLFEVRAPDELRDWRGFFADTLAWGALARADAGRELLDGDGTHAREAVMAALLDRHRTQPGAVVVVTGAFHTLALLDTLDDTPEAAWVRAHRPAELDPQREAWLIRYDFERLDGLRGYGAGMPAPGFWQRVWQARTAGTDARSFTTEVLLEVAGRLREAEVPVGSATVLDAAQQALRLAELRGRDWPGRTDIADALLSCFVKDDLGLSGAIGDALAAVFGGPDLGDIPDGLAAPPLVAEARREAVRLRFSIADARLRQVSLDTQRKPAHVRRREFLARMRFAGSGFARQIGGADLVQGTGAGLLFEEWEYAWTPLVEAALIAASAHGATLAELVQDRVRRRLAADDVSSGRIARLLAELLVMGEAAALQPAMDRLRAGYADDPQLGSVVDSLHALLDLLDEQGRLRLGEQATAVRDLVEVGLAAAAGLIAPLAGLRDDDLDPACTQLIALRSVLLRSPGGTAASAVRRELRRLRERRATPARLHGCLIGLAFCDAELGTGELARATAGHLAPGADPERVAGFVLGLLQSAPDLLLHTPELLGALNTALASMPVESFLAVLPDLRRAFTWLKPTETHRLAALVADLTGAAPAVLDAVIAVDPALAARAAVLERDLVAGLTRDALTAWVAS